MTDKELLEQFLFRLGLTKVEACLSCQLDSNEYTEIKDEFEGNTIRIGCGLGYNTLVAEFYFDKNGKALNHGVWE
jgi:hypothetical protein